MNATAGPRIGERSGGWLAALPDLAMALMFLAVWIAPTAFPRSQLKGLALVVLLEFVLIHGTVLLGTLAEIRGTFQTKRGLALLFVSLALIYLAFVVWLATSFGERWPYLAFAWLVASKVAGVFFSPAPRAKERERQNILWIVSIATYLLAFFPTALLPLPAVGLTPEVLAVMPVDGFGAWVEAPQKLCAYGFVYFGVMAIARARVRNAG